MNLQPNSVGLAELIDRILDKGLVINADIKIELAGTEILGIRLRAALASFETAAKFGLAFPSGTNLNAPAWKVLGCHSENTCPECGKFLYVQAQKMCPCGWNSIAVKHKNEKLLEVSQKKAKNESNNPQYKINEGK